jgi:hypothetical protein
VGREHGVAPGDGRSERARGEVRQGRAQRGGGGKDRDREWGLARGRVERGVRDGGDEGARFVDLHREHGRADPGESDGGAFLELGRVGAARGARGARPGLALRCRARGAGRHGDEADLARLERRDETQAPELRRDGEPGDPLGLAQGVVDPRAAEFPGRGVKLEGANGIVAEHNLDPCGPRARAEPRRGVDALPGARCREAPVLGGAPAAIAAPSGAVSPLLLLLLLLLLLGLLRRRRSMRAVMVMPGGQVGRFRQPRSDADGAVGLEQRLEPGQGPGQRVLAVVWEGAAHIADREATERSVPRRARRQGRPGRAAVDSGHHRRGVMSAQEPLVPAGVPRHLGRERRVAARRQVPAPTAAAAPRALRDLEHRYQHIGQR